MNWFNKHFNKTSTKFLLVLAVFMCILLISADYGCALQDLFLGDDDWPMFKFNLERTSATGDFDFDTIDLQWRYEYDLFEQAGASRISPAASFDMVVIPTRHFANCRNINNGEILWSQYIGENYSSPVIYKGNVIISSFGAIYSFNLRSGSVVWNKNLTKEKEYVNGGSSVAAVSDDKIYYGLRGRDDSEGYLYCIDAQDGSTIWKYHTDGAVQTSPIVIEGKVIFGSDDHSVHCLNADSGDNIWTYYTGDIIRSSPAVHDNRVFFGSNDAYVYCLDIEDGSMVWRFKTGGKVTATPTISKDKLFVSSNDQFLYCLNVDNGRFVWKHRTGDSMYTSPTVCGNKILLGFGDSIYCLDTKTGSLIWSYKLDDVGTSTPLTIHNGKLFFRTTKFVYCFDLS